MGFCLLIIYVACGLACGYFKVVGDEENYRSLMQGFMSVTKIMALILASVFVLVIFFKLLSLFLGEF